MCTHGKIPTVPKRCTPRGGGQAWRPLWPCDCRILRGLLEAKVSKKAQFHCILQSCTTKNRWKRWWYIYIYNLLNIYIYIYIHTYIVINRYNTARLEQLIHPMLQLDVPWRSLRSFQAYHAKIGGTCAVSAAYHTRWPRIFWLGMVGFRTSWLSRFLGNFAKQHFGGPFWVRGEVRVWRVSKIILGKM